MTLDLVDYEKKAEKAVYDFWNVRTAAAQRQAANGRIDQGERAGVTSGKNMDGFLSLLTQIVHRNGLQDATICLKKGLLPLPGFFRATKMWDVLVMDGRRLVAALELKSQVGPSFGNNFNNRTEEAIGTAHDFWTAVREGVLGDQPPPFLGWLMLVEDCAESRAPVRETSPHFRVFPEFQGASYTQRYEILCRRLVTERLYSQTALLLSPREAGAKTGAYTELSETTSLTSFVSGLAAHVAAVAASRNAATR